MRQIGTISDSNHAEKFADHLRAQGVACTVDQEGQGFRIWVHDDDRVPAAKEEFQHFSANPDDVRYQDAQIRAREKLREDTARQKSAKKKIVNVSDTWGRPTSHGCPMTFGLIAISVVVAYFSDWNPQFNDPRVSALWISNDGTLGQILHGEIWRLVTPIFLHFNVLHLLFNMLMTRQFGTQIEDRLGPFKFLLMVLVIAAVSNFFQFCFAGPRFGGMSGVVYGLFGYIWVRGHLEPATGFDLPQSTVTMMVFWYLICMLQVVPRTANWVHEAGLVMGITLAFSRELIRRVSQKR